MIDIHIFEPIVIGILAGYFLVEVHMIKRRLERLEREHNR